MKPLMEAPGLSLEWVQSGARPAGRGLHHGSEIEDEFSAEGA